MQWILAGVLAVVVLPATHPALAACISTKCQDADAIERARELIQDTCGCTRSGQTHGTYKKCVQSTLKLANVTALIPQKPCRKLIMKCEGASICGKPNAAVCCVQKKNGKVKSSIVKSASRCKGIACGALLGFYSKVDACAADGTCAGPVTTTTTTGPQTTTTVPPPVTSTTTLPGSVTTTLPAVIPTTLPVVTTTTAPTLPPTTTTTTLPPTTTTTLPLVADYLGFWEFSGERTVNTCTATFGLPQFFFVTLYVESYFNTNLFGSAYDHPTGFFFADTMQGTATYPQWVMTSAQCELQSIGLVWCGRLSLTINGLPVAPLTVPAAMTVNFTFFDGRPPCVQGWSGYLAD